MDELSIAGPAHRRRPPAVHRGRDRLEPQRRHGALPPDHRRGEGRGRRRGEVPVVVEGVAHRAGRVRAQHEVRKAGSVGAHARAGGREVPADAGAAPGGGRHCRSRGITFLSSCFSREEVDLLESLGAPAYKIASMDVNHLPLLEVVARTGKPVILSTGMATLGEIECGAGRPPPRRLRAGRPSPLRLDVSVSGRGGEPAEHPDAADDVRRARRAERPQPRQSPIPLAAVALGACLIEKHFTVDKKLEGWDHAISADPGDLAALVRGSREVFDALGRAERVVGDDGAREAKGLPAADGGAAAAEEGRSAASRGRGLQATRDRHSPRRARLRRRAAR